jgi:hypothetical protein
VTRAKSHRQPEGRGLGRYVGAAHVFGRGVLEDAVDHAGAVEAGHDRQASRHRRWLVPAHFLERADVQLDMWPVGCQRVQTALLAPPQVPAQVGVGVDAGLALEPSQIGRDGQPQHARRGDDNTGNGRPRLRDFHSPSAQAGPGRVNHLMRSPSAADPDGSECER